MSVNLENKKKRKSKDGSRRHSKKKQSATNMCLDYIKL